MTRTTMTKTWAAAACAALVSASACTMQDASAPAPSGPSELGLSVSLAANPDVLAMDGASQSQIVITTRNSNGQPQSGIGVRADILYGGQVIDYGHLSSKGVTTGSDGRATITYTAPAGNPSGSADSGANLVTIRVTPVGSDAAASVPRSVSIRLVPQGPSVPRAGSPVAKFEYRPTAPTEGQQITFDASQSVDCLPDQTVPDCLANSPPLVAGLSYSWDFGDGYTGSGINTRYGYRRAGIYIVTLTVTNARGVSSATSQFLEVGAPPTTPSGPTADFVFSPTAPAANQNVFFDGRTSTAAEGASITRWEWNFGDGTVGEGERVTHTYTAAGNYIVVLTVTDSRGTRATTTKSVTVS